MTGAAWVMMLVTWGVITFFTAKFFFLVLTKPPKSGEDQE